jgi:hypothetical protein
MPADAAQAADRLDAMLTAPNHHEVLLENDHVASSIRGWDPVNAHPFIRTDGQARFM